MARRATFIKTLADEIDRERTLLLAGPNELFAKRDASARPEAHRAPAFADAYAAMGYDAVYVTQDEALWLQQNAGRTPELFKSVDQKGLVETHDLDGVRVAVVAFPEPVVGHNPTDAQTAWVVETIKDLRAGEGAADLVVGVSPWGKLAEQQFLEAAAAAPDILLGGGPGPGHPEVLTRNGETLWVRSYYKGRALNLVRVFALPQAGQWQFGVDFTTEVQALDETIADDPAMRTLFH